MALSNQSDLPAFFSPQKVNLKKDLIPEDDLPRMVKSQMMTYRDWSKQNLTEFLVGGPYSFIEMI
jgi:hypothetical protein